MIKKKTLSVSLGENWGGLKPGGRITWRLIHSLLCHQHWEDSNHWKPEQLRLLRLLYRCVNPLCVLSSVVASGQPVFLHHHVRALNKCVMREKWLSRCVWPSLKRHIVSLLPCLTGWRNDEGTPNFKRREHRSFFFRGMWMSHCRKSMWHGIFISVFSKMSFRQCRGEFEFGKSPKKTCYRSASKERQHLGTYHIKDFNVRLWKHPHLFF